MSAVQPDDAVQIGGFFDYIFDSEEGYVYVAHKVPENQYKFNQTFFHWPSQRGDLIQHVINLRGKYEVYYAPALFSAPSALKEHIRGSRVFWCEFDGSVPDAATLESQAIPPPTLRVLSSDAGHEHWYWKLESVVDVPRLERVNRAVTYLLGADTSGWDANQILRPPVTFNHKRQRPVIVCGYEEGFVSPEQFVTLPEPPPVLETPVPERIPDINEVVFKYQFPAQVTRLFKVGLPVGKRSEGMMALGYYLAELNLTNEEMLAMLLNADERWGKFSGRDDQLKRLMEIITIARQKYPYRQGDAPLGVPHLQPMGFLTLLRSDIKVEWFWDGYLQKAGYMCLTGPSQVGKTQFALDVAGAMALGTSALDSVCNQGRIGFFSLEMNAAELKEFLLLQAFGYTPEQQQVLEENLLLFPLGEPLYMNKAETREQIEQTVRDFKLDGIIVDSMGSATDGSLSEETAVKGLLDWNDSFRQRAGVFTWFIHHHRKANGDNKRPNKLSDVYGNQYITARATSVICLWESGIANTLDFIPLKIRLRANPGKFHIKRGGDLRFVKMAPGMVTETALPEESGLVTNDESDKLEELEVVTSAQPIQPKKQEFSL